MKKAVISILTFLALSGISYAQNDFHGYSEEVICEHPIGNGCMIKDGRGQDYKLSWKDYVRYITKEDNVTLYGLGYRHDGMVIIYFTFD